MNKGRIYMEFSYENITLGDLDVEFNYINFAMECDGDNQIVRCGLIDDEENNAKR